MKSFKEFLTPKVEKDTSSKQRIHFALEPVSDIRERFKSGEVFNCGDVVVKGGEILQVVEQKTNYVVCEDNNGETSKNWLKDLTPINEASVRDFLIWEPMGELQQIADGIDKLKSRKNELYRGISKGELDVLKKLGRVTSKGAGNTSDVNASYVADSIHLAGRFALVNYRDHKNGYILVLNKNKLPNVEPRDPGNFITDYIADDAVVKIIDLKKFVKKGVNIKKGVKESTELEEEKEEDDLQGPDRYYSKDAEGDEMAKSTKKKRSAFFKKQSKKDDDDPSAYEPAPGDKSAKTKPSKHTKRFKQIFGESSENLEESNPKKAVQNKAEKTGISFDILWKVYKRGVGAWKTGHRPGTTPEQWGLARVNSFVTGGKTQKTTDADLWKMVKESAETDGFVPPAGAASAAKKALKWRDEHGEEVKAMTRVGWARANQLAKREKLSLDVVRRMAAFARHKKNSEINPKYKDTPWKDKGYVAWLGWGGDAGIEWAKRISKQQED